ncbi:hypothetical protein K432DRAFT_418204 [Lepidopterella palustris CBS 459.81]|uniref:Uncharacterized protein n=1 Tax=Lepidopterella palustris CBS 459.81 TaxID=1314670 RepID=A0A8E2JD36_9PEZI|nr:hypothetical protein K432DRAFT_418204 [Lepidopterella palustris CBS 459.81]
MSLALMSPDKTPACRTRKRKRAISTDTPPQFWDNLSRKWLTPRALQELDRRTIWPVAAPIPPDRSGLKEQHSIQLKRFARHGGPSLRDLRAYPGLETKNLSVRIMSSSQSRAGSGTNSPSTSSRTTLRTKKNSAYDACFEQHLIDNCIYPEGYNTEPDNLDEIKERLAQPRPSLSPSSFTRETFLEFKRKNRDAVTEAEVMGNVFPIIKGNANIPSGHNRPFGNLAPLTDGTLVDPKPDFYDGSRPIELDRHVRNELGPHIAPSRRLTAPLLPNFSMEAKGPDGSAAVAKRQACYDGAIGARAMHSLQSFGEDGETYDGNAHTITSTYQSGTGCLKLYTIHLTRSAGSGTSPEYHMTQLGGWDVTDSHKQFCEGAGAFRNARDWAKEQRDEAIAMVNKKVIERHLRD